MGGFSSQVQPSQSSSPAGKNAGMSSMQMGMNPIEQSPQDQLLKTQQLQTEQPNFPQGNQIVQNGMGPPLGGMMGAQNQAELGSMANPDQQMQLGAMGTFAKMQNQTQSGLNEMDPQPMQQQSPAGSPQGKSGAQGAVTFPGQGKQPKFGMPNAYSNTAGPWDNQASQQSQGLSGKGLGQMSKPIGKGA